MPSSPVEHTFFGSTTPTTDSLTSYSAPGSVWNQFQVQAAASCVGARIYASSALIIGLTITLGVIPDPAGTPVGSTLPTLTRSASFTVVSGWNIVHWAAPLSLTNGQRLAVVAWNSSLNSWPLRTGLFSSTSAIQASDNAQLWVVSSASPPAAAPWRNSQAYYDSDMGDLSAMYSSDVSFCIDPIVTFG